MLSCPRGEHCDRHPRFFAGLRLDCGNYHQLCVGCIRRWLDEGGDGKLCPMCRQQIGNGGCDIEELKELIEKVQAHKAMTNMDPALPLPTELTTEIFRFVDSIDLAPKLLVSRIVYSEFLATARKNRNGWNTEAWDYNMHWSGGRNMVINETQEMTNVVARRPFGCHQNCEQKEIHHQHVDYFEVKMDRFVEDLYWCWVLVGLSAPDFLDEVQRRGWLGRLTNSYAVGCNGFYQLSGRSIQNFVGFFPGDVIGCGLITNSHWKAKRQLFFTKNGQLIGKPLWISPRQIQLFPTISLRGLGSQLTANFGDNPAKPFLYDLSPHLAPEQRKGKKRKANDSRV